MPFVYEFLFRGKEDGTGDYHVVLGEAVGAFGEVRRVCSEPLTPAQAAAAGFGLSEIISEINEAAVRQVGVLERELSTARAKIRARQTRSKTTKRA